MNSYGHLIVSILKSTLRIGSCIYCLVSNILWPLAAGFLVAEILGVLEEIVDER